MSPACDGERSDQQTEAALWKGAGQLDRPDQGTALHQPSYHNQPRPCTNSKVNLCTFNFKTTWIADLGNIKKKEHSGGGVPFGNCDFFEQ